MSTVVYLKRTASDTGRTVITQHSVWNLDRFLASQQQEQRNLAAQDLEHAVISIATQNEYRAFAWPKS